MSEQEQATWVQASLRATLETLGGLVELSLRGHALSLAPLMRDYLDHVELWGELLDASAASPGGRTQPGPVAGTPLRAIEAAAFAGRLAAAMAGRIRATTPELRPEARRIAFACLADLDNHLHWAAGRLSGWTCGEDDGCP
ncbi:MAG: hypothetical protein ACE5HF_02800 [Gemmatimonadota bacterium]